MFHSEKDKHTDGVTNALEDYLETIFELMQDHNFARIKDIAIRRGVKSSSVTPAMRRLDEQGLIKYVRREYIVLTSEGEQLARKIHAKHQVMKRFFKEVLKVSSTIAEKDACSMEHSLSIESMDAFVKFFEFIDACPNGKKSLESFHRCALINMDAPVCGEKCSLRKNLKIKKDLKMRNISQLKPGEKGIVTQIEGKGAIRQRLLEMGIIPNVTIEVERVSLAGDTIWIKLHSFQISLRLKEAASVVVAAV